MCTKSAPGTGIKFKMYGMKSCECAQLVGECLPVRGMGEYEGYIRLLPQVCIYLGKFECMYVTYKSFKSRVYIHMHLSHTAWQSACGIQMSVHGIGSCFGKKCCFFIYRNFSLAVRSPSIQQVPRGSRTPFPSEGNE